MSSTLRIAQRRTVDRYRVAVVPHAAQQRVHHGFVAEKVVPLIKRQVGGDDSGVAMIALLHQLEKRVRLLGLEIQVAKLVDQKDIQTGQAIQQTARGAIGQRGVHLIEQILRADELATVAILQGLQYDPASQSGFAHAGRPRQHQILVLGDEVELGEGADLLAVYTMLARVRN